MIKAEPRRLSAGREREGRGAMIWADFHMHTAASEDSDAPIAAMFDAAMSGGFQVVAVTDHVEMTGFRELGYDLAAEESWRMMEETIPAYAGRLRVARGVELGQPLYDLAAAERVLAAHPYDFVLGSQHKLGDEVDYYFYDYTHVDVGEAMDRYFDATLELVKWGRFHSLAHLTYPFRYIPAEKRPADYSRWQDRIDAVFRALRDRDIALEINVSGLRNPLVNSAHPDLPLVRRFRELGGEKITVGADAHRPEDVGAHIRDGLLIAREAGFRYTAVYFGGRAEMCAIEL